MKTIINMKIHNSVDIKNTHNITYKSLKSILIIKDAIIYQGHIPCSDKIYWVFRTSKYNNLLTKLFNESNRIFVLDVIKDGYFPTIIHLNKGYISYTKFIELYNKNEINIVKMDTEIREIITTLGNTFRNRVRDIYCEFKS